MTQPSVLVVAGHRSYKDSGNPNEKALTFAMASAYESALESAGYSVTNLQSEWDGDADPDDTVGGLDTVGWACHEWMKQTPGPLVMFDCHYEGSSAPGVFAIVPDMTGLGTGVVIPQPADDVWASNTSDIALARAISEQISSATGLPLRWTTLPGVMSETRTGVALQYGARLAMFAYTAPFRLRAVRLVVEHGSLPVESDRNIIMQPGFAEKCAGAVVRAMDSIYATQVPVEPRYATPAKFPFELGVDLGWHKIGSTDVYSFMAQGTARARVIKRAWAQDAAPVSGLAYELGDHIVLCGEMDVAVVDTAGDLVLDSDGNQKYVGWYIDSDGNRIRRSKVATSFKVVR